MNGVNPQFVAAIRGPIIMITIGILFLLDKFTALQFGETWPLILIVLGVIALAGGSKRSVRGSTSNPDYVQENVSPIVNPGVPPPGVRR